jgi:hypothetical protein
MIIDATTWYINTSIVTSTTEYIATARPTSIWLWR